MQHFEQIDKILDKMGASEFDKIEPLKKMADKVGVKPRYLVAGFTVLLIILMILSIGASFLAGFVGFLYPAYMSFKALETKETREDDKQWLTYWVVFSFTTVFDSLFAMVLSFLPVYSVLKVCFYIWLFHPKTLGASIIYNNILKKFLLKYEKEIDQKIDQAKKKLDDAISSGTKEAKNYM